MSTHRPGIPVNSSLSPTSLLMGLPSLLARLSMSTRLRVQTPKYDTFWLSGLSSTETAEAGSSTSAVCMLALFQMAMCPTLSGSPSGSKISARKLRAEAAVLGFMGVNDSSSCRAGRVSLFCVSGRGNPALVLPWSPRGVRAFCHPPHVGVCYLCVFLLLAPPDGYRRGLFFVPY